MQPAFIVPPSAPGRVSAHGIRVFPSCCIPPCFSFHPRRALLFPYPGLLSCRDKPALPFAAHPPIIPNTENTVERYYYYRLFGIVAFLLGFLHRDTW